MAFYMSQSTESDEKLEDISSAVIKQLTASCPECGITSDIIDREQHSFACFPESPTSVTYRARLEGTSETDSGSLISLIEKWVSGGASIIVTGVLMRVDSECSVAISSLSERECSPTQPPPPITTTDNTTDTESPSIFTDQSFFNNTVAVIGGVVAVVIVLIIAITIIVIVIVIVNLVWKNRRGGLSIKIPEK